MRFEMRQWPALLLVVIAACTNMPEPYRPAMRRQPMAGPDITHLKHFVPMSDPYAQDHILQDVSMHLEPAGWRWTGKRPTFRMVLPSTNKLRLLAEFWLNDEGLKTTGPLTIAFSVNGKLLDKAAYSSPGSQKFEKAVDASWLRANDDTIVTMDLDKTWRSGDRELGVQLFRIGFLD